MEKLAAIAYEAWRDRIAPEAVNLGLPYPARWSDLAPGARAAWMASVHAAVKHINVDPNRYRGY
jgi:hypothetical protein